MSAAIEERDAEIDRLSAQVERLTVREKQTNELWRIATFKCTEARETIERLRTGLRNLLADHNHETANAARRLLGELPEEDSADAR